MIISFLTWDYSIFVRHIRFAGHFRCYTDSAKEKDDCSPVGRRRVEMESKQKANDHYLSFVETRAKISFYCLLGVCVFVFAAGQFSTCCFVFVSIFSPSILYVVC